MKQVLLWVGSGPGRHPEMAAIVAPAVMPMQISIAGARAAQRAWGRLPLARRLRVLRSARHLIAAESAALVDAFPATLSRTRADSYAAEVLPLLDACRFLEREAKQILRGRALGSQGKPFWMGRVEASIARVPYGVVLLIGPSNYPLLLPGVQALQALAAGNAVVWKPGREGAEVAQRFVTMLHRAGLPEALIQVTEDSAEAGIAALEAGPDKVIFTGSSQTGRAVLALAAQRVIPVVAELAGCDACIVLNTADASRVADALEFAMRFNGSATCMAPRRLLLVGPGHDALIGTLRQRFAEMDAIEVPWATRRQLSTMLMQAGRECSLDSSRMKPLLVEDGNVEMRLTQTDVMAPVITVVRVADIAELLEMDGEHPLGLTASIFGDEAEARRLAAELTVGSVLINDVIVPTADARVPFGGRRGSGYGVTRGAEGLLEMTAVRTTIVRHGGSTRHYEATDERHEALFAGTVALSHSGTFAKKIKGLGTMLSALRRLGRRATAGDKQ